MKRVLLNGYGVAIWATLGLVIVLSGLQPIFQGLPPLNVLLIGVMLATWQGGFWAGLFASMLSGFAGAYLFTEPVYSFELKEAGEQLRLGLFLGIGSLLSAVLSRLRRAEQRALLQARQEKDQLEQAMAARERTEDRLRESEERYRLLVEQNVDGILVHDARQQYVEANPAACRMLGYRREEILGRTVADMVVAEERPRITPAEARFAGGDAAPREFRCRRKDGSVFIGEVTGSRLPDGRFLGILRDITERKQIEQSLRQLQEEHELILDSVPAMIWYKDTENRILRVNASAARSLGLPKEAIEGKSTAEFYPNDAERYHQDDLLVVRTGRPRLGIEEPYELPGGETRWLRTDKIPLRDDSGTVTGILVMSADITDQQRAREALRESEARYRTIFDLSPSGVVVVCPDNGAIVDCNDQAAHNLGYSRDEFTRLRIADIEAQETQPDVMAHIARIRVSGGEAFETKHRGRTGELRNVMVKVRPITLAGQPQMLSVFEDVTELKHAEQALREADRRKDEFLATLAHELRNPLAPIHIAVHLLRKIGGGETSAEALLAMLERQVNHLVRLVDDLLEVSRISRGKIELKKERVDLAAVVDHALETSRPLIEAGGHVLNVFLPLESLVLEADPVRLAQVLANLLNNAAKYTKAGGQIEVMAERRDGEAVVSVRDTGLGISAEMLPRVFDLFAQVDPNLGRAHGGLGIGLALVRSLVELHGGRVEARSEGLGRGSEFLIYLPLAAAPVNVAASVTPVPSFASTTRRILIVDDNRDVADSLALLLRSSKVAVRVVYDGLSALDALTDFRPEVVLLDLGMPGMDGFEVARRLRRTPEGGGLTLIALTGWGQDEDRRRTREAGFDHHLIKPVDLDLLQTLLASVDGRQERG